MPGSSLELEMRLKDQKVQVGMDALAAKEEKVGSTLSKIAKEAKQADAELNRFAKRTTEINTTPLEKYNRTLFVADQALRRGKISQETYNREVKRSGEELEKAKKKQDSAFAADALGQIKSFAAGYLTLGAAVNVVASAFAHAREESKEALGSLRGLDAQRRKLVQMADSPADLQAMLSRADTAAAATGVDRGTAYDVLFQAKSFGQEKDYEKILGANEVIESKAAMELAGKVTQMFGGKITGMQAINMAIAAGKPSEVDAESIGGSLAMALEGGRRVGATPDETFAWVSALSTAFKSPLVAADRIKAITNKAAVPGSPLRDAGGLTEIMKGLQAMPESERAEILGKDQESNAAYEAMVEFYGKQQEIEKAVREARLATGTSRDPLSLGLAYAGATEQTQASLKARQADLAKQTAREAALGGLAAEGSSGASQAEAAGYRAGIGIGQQYGGHLGGELAQGLRGGRTATLLSSGAGTAIGGALSGDLVSNGNAGVFQWLAQVMTQLVLESRTQTAELKELNTPGSSGGVGRSTSAAALAPQN